MKHLVAIGISRKGERSFKIKTGGKDESTGKEKKKHQKPSKI